MPRRGIGRFGGGKKLDRGRATHGAKWCFVTLDDQMINYAQHRAAFEASHLCTSLTDEQKKKAWAKHTQSLREATSWELFKSLREAKHYIHLRALVSVGLIRSLARQVKMPLNALGGGLVGHYIADFVYEERKPAENHAAVEWTKVVAEVKGYEEDLWIWKKKHFEAQYGIPLRQS